MGCDSQLLPRPASLSGSEVATARSAERPHLRAEPTTDLHQHVALLRLDLDVGTIRYITHPEVTIDPEVPVVEWGLSRVGSERARVMLDQPWVRRIDRVVSSEEVKALQFSEVIARHRRLRVEVRPATGENDRTSTGYLPPAEFEELADAFFASPTRSVRRWETAVDAQTRIVTELADLLDSPSDGEVVVVGHGGVGTLWLCWLAEQPIHRRHDQDGQGRYFTIRGGTRQIVHTWRPIDQIEL